MRQNSKVDTDALQLGRDTALAASHTSMARNKDKPKGSNNVTGAVSL